MNTTQIIRNIYSLEAIRNGKLFAYKGKGRQWVLRESVHEMASHVPFTYLHSRQVKRLMEALGGVDIPMPSQSHAISIWKVEDLVLVEVSDRDSCQMVERYASDAGGPLYLKKTRADVWDEWEEDDEW